VGEVIEVAFGTEREWQETHQRLVEGLVDIGALFGDEADLMRAKADAAHRILRRIIEGVPPIRVVGKIPESLTPEQVDLIARTLKDAAIAGVEIAMTHAVEELMAGIYDLCTSKLGRVPQ
jgi:hypothetical protein